MKVFVSKMSPLKANFPGAKTTNVMVVKSVMMTGSSPVLSVAPAHFPIQTSELADATAKLETEVHVVTSEQNKPEPAPLRVTPPLYTYSNPDKSKQNSQYATDDNQPESSESRENCEDRLTNNVGSGDEKEINNEEHDGDQ